MPLHVTGESGRDRVLDGFRAYAVAAVIVGHAMAYRYASQMAALGYIGRQLRRLSGPLSDLGVYLFFAISGYIITHLLLREEARTGRISLTAFFLRRALRILPPLLAYLAALYLLASAGEVDTPMSELPRALFTCNLGLYECNWYTAHTWSLAVEEQFYLAWPLLLATFAAVRRGLVAAALLAVLVAIYAVMPFTFHSNALSFACIAGGVSIALRPAWRKFLAVRTGAPIWFGATALAVLGPVFIGNKLTGLLMPGLVLIVLFGSYGIAWLKPLLTARPVQWIAAMSYSLYLWQQLFLARTELGGGLPMWLLPIAALVSMAAVERPLITLAHRLSRRLAPGERHAADAPAMRTV